MELAMSKDDLGRLLQTEFPQVAQEMVVDEVSAQGLVLRLRVSAAHLRPGGTVSGPAMFGLADVALYLCLLSRIGPQALAVTTNASIDFLRKPAQDRDVIASARLLKLGRVLAVGDALIYSQGLPDPVARANMTYSIPHAPR